MNTTYGLFENATKSEIDQAKSFAYIKRLKLGYQYLSSEEILEILEKEFQGKTKEEAINLIENKSQACDFVKSRFIEKLVDLIYQ